FDTVLYVRASCADPATELACNDDIDSPSPRPLASRVSFEVGAGDTLYVVVDGYDGFAAGAYALRVRGVPALATGSPCDPTSVVDACRTGNICTRASGMPRCAPGTAPTLTMAAAQILENGRSVRVVVAGGDIDADAVASRFEFLDAGDGVLTTAQRALPAAALGQTWFGPLVGYLQDGLLDAHAAVRVRVQIVDAVGLRSA